VCIIIHREPGAGHLSDDIIRHHRRVNPDGFGIAWRGPNGVESIKFAPNDFERFHERLKSIDADAGVEYVAHFRTATHGKPCEDLSHPFTYEDAKDGKVVVFHNGIIPITPAEGDSDTGTFVRAVLAKLAPRWWAKSAYKFLVEEAIGYSRLLVMTNNETVRFGSTNHGGWNKRDGLWFSTTALPYSSSTSQTYGGSTVKSLSSGGTTSDPKAPTRLPQSWKGWVKGADGIWRQKPEGSNDEPGTSEDDDNYDEPLGWYQKGPDGVNHYIEALTEEEDDHGDMCGDCLCTVCDTVGEWYVIDGQTYVDIEHSEEDADEETDEVMERLQREAM
jgi:hypothetical protein